MTGPKFHPITKADEWFAGEKKTFIFHVQDEDEQPIDISGWQLRWLVKNNSGATSAVFEVEGTVTEALTGEVTVEVESGTTAEAEPHTYYHQLWRMNDGFEAVLSHGPAALL